MKFATSILLLFQLIFFAITTEASDPQDFWNHYRSVAPLVTHEIIASKISAAGDAIVIVTEPPAHVYPKRDTLFKKVFGVNYVSQEEFSYRVGYDGWVKDIVLTLRDLDDQILDDRIADLHTELHGTAYKASYHHFTPNPWDTKRFPVKRLGPPNLKINAASLNDWLFENPLEFLDLTVGTEKERNTSPFPRILSDLFSLKKTGVFFSEQPGLVLLVIDRSRNLNELRPLLRQFTLDTDILLGAVVESDTTAESQLLAIIGRERTTALSEMGPLHVDTILLLSAAKETDLAQSYERTAPFAGRIINADIQQFVNIREKIDPRVAISRLLFDADGVDWAPILLSRELTHTEYGQLLNITDQMLKGWSMSNDIAYGNFTYRAPLDYPDISGVMDRIEKEMGQPFTQLTFNWNTTGFGSWSEFGTYRIFSLQQTGALPISYIADSSDIEVTEEIEKIFISAEDEYGSFFAELQDPYLNRVAQYAALHLIFQTYPVKSEREEPLINEEDYTNRWHGLKGSVSDALDRIVALRGTDPDELVEMSQTDIEHFGEGCNMNMSNAAEIWQTSAQNLVESAARYQVHPDDGLNRLVEAMLEAKLLYGKLSPERDALIKLEENYNASVNEFNSTIRKCNSYGASNLMSCSSSVLSMRRDSIEEMEGELTKRMNQFRQREDDLGHTFADAQALNSVVKMFGSCSVAFKSVIKGNPQPKGSFYRTPSIVVSSAVLQWSGIGGHNLNGRSVSVVADGKVRSGTIRISDDGNVIRLNPSDIPQSSRVAREFERFRMKYLSGDQAYRQRTISRLNATLAQKANVVQSFEPGVLGRTGAEPSIRGLGEHNDAGRNFIDRRVTLTSGEASKITSYADAAGADFVVGRDKSSYRIFYPKGHPPFAIETRSPVQFQRNLELAARDTVTSETATSSEVVVISDGTLGVKELQGLRVSSSARQVVAEANGGGIGLPPSQPPRQGFFFEKDGKGSNRGGGQGSRDGNGGNGSGSIGGDTGSSRRTLAFYPASRKTARVLKRIDVDWSKATVTETSITAPTESGGLVVAVLNIPSLSTRPSLFARLTAVFRKRKPTRNDLDLLIKVAQQETASTSKGSMVKQKIEAIRAAYEQAVDGDATLRAIIKEGDIDFFIVEKEADANTDNRQSS